MHIVLSLIMFVACFSLRKFSGLTSDLLIQVESPYCCDVCPSVNEGTESCVKFTLNGVPTDKLASSKDK